MEKLLELEDIALIPSLNKGWVSDSKLNYFVKSEEEVTGLKYSLPIFTSPMNSIVDRNNCALWQNVGIKAVLPRTEDLQTRLEACCSVFAAFSINEVKEEFINKDKPMGFQYHICIDAGNGQDYNIFQLGVDLRKKYCCYNKNQIILMAGNIGNCDTYTSYAKSGFDYVRVGMSSGYLVDKDKFGFHYPMASLVSDIINLRKTTCIGLRTIPKIIVDGGITCLSDIMKAIAIGADYVMLGHEFAKIVESAGAIYIKKPDKTSETGYSISEVSNIPELLKLNSYELSKRHLIRLYQGNTTREVQASRLGYKLDNFPDKEIKLTDSESRWVGVDKTLNEWLSNFKDCIKYGFMMTNSTCWNEFKSNAKVVRIQ